MAKQRRVAGGQADGYFITGGTGFIGRFLIERLLRRSGTLYVLVRQQSLSRLQERASHWKIDSSRLVPVIGDLTEPQLGLSARQLRQLAGRVGHFFHVGGLYDMTASAEALTSTNVAGTEHAVDVAARIGAKRFHHVSSIAAAGRYPGVFFEDMFEEATGLDDPYFRSKHDSESVVRRRCSVPWRIYRPALVVGHSETGEMDKVDGPYYFFPILERLAAALPPLVPLPGIDGGYLNLVPVDFVAAAVDRIAHLEAGDGSTFHLVDPIKRTVGDTLDILAEAAGAPRFSLRLLGVEEALLPLSRLVARTANGLAGRWVENTFGMPPRVFDYVSNPTSFDCKQTLAALAGSGIHVPSLDAYAPHLWAYWQRSLNTNTTHGRNLERAIRGKRVLITGASSGIGRATAIKLGAAGAQVLLVARDAQRLDEVRQLVERVGGVATVLPADLTDPASVEQLCRTVAERCGGVDVLINNAGRSIRRSLHISQGRFHDFERTMQINYFGAVRLILGLLPEMRRRRRGHIINISSIGAQVGPPRFAAYIASKAALDGFSRCAAPELLGDGIDMTTVYMPLVKTEMIAPTRLYDSFSSITPAQAADLICAAIIDRPKQVSTTLGLIGQVTASLLPSLFDVALYLAYRLFPDSAAARGQVSVDDEQPTNVGHVFARLLPGVHW